MSEENGWLKTWLQDLKSEVVLARTEAAGARADVAALRVEMRADALAAQQERKKTADKLEAHLSAHGLGHQGAERVSPWVAPTSMTAWHARGRIMVLLLVLLSIAVPATLPYLGHLRTLVSP